MDDLLQRCQAGDPNAITTLVARYRVHALDLAAALLRDEHLAHDAVQEAFLVALAQLATLREPAAFPGWFRQIVRSQCTRLLRRRRELPVDPQDDAGPAATLVAAPDASPGHAIERRELRAQVAAALAALPAINREAAVLYYLEERNCAEIGTALQIPVGTVKRRLHDARHRLRAMLLGQIPLLPPDATATLPAARLRPDPSPTPPPSRPPHAPP